MPVPGRKSITISEDTYQTLRTLARKREMSATELAEFLIDQYSQPFIRTFIDEIARGAGLQESYEDIISDTKIGCYLSTCWIRTKDYIKNIGPIYWVIDKRLRNPNDLVIVEKIFIISRSSWSIKEVWDYIGYWLIYCSLPEEKFKLFIIKEKDADRIAIEKDTGRILSEYYDMGIYKEISEKKSPDVIVGFLSIDEESRPGPYRKFFSIDSPEVTMNAERYFEALKTGAYHLKTIQDFVELQKQKY
ncbi:MAG: hypothetical protein QW279_13840 [Candidatus Jordarchaeaceae archaeon]